MRDPASCVFPGRLRRALACSALIALVASVAAVERVHAQATDHPTRPIEVLVTVTDEAPRCQPQELRVPADGNIDLRITNQGAKPVAFRAPDLFRKDAVRTFANAEAEKDGTGYVVASRASAQMLVKAPPQGQYRFACVEPGAASAEATGTLVTVR